MVKTQTRAVARKPALKAKPPATPAILYSAYQHATEREAAEVEQSQPDPLARFAMLGAAAFDSAATLAALATSSRPVNVTAFVGAFVRLDVFLAGWRELPDRELWQRWPTTPGVTCGRYMRAGDSALDVAIGFATSVRNGVLAARVESIHTFHVESLAVMPKPDAKLRKWCNAAVRELRDKTLGLRAWAMPELHRDTDALLRQIGAEFVQATAATDVWVGPRSPSDWAKLFRTTSRNFARMRKGNPPKVRTKPVTTKLVYVHRDDLPKGVTAQS